MSIITTFYVGENLFGIEVLNVQEVTGNLPMIEVPIAPSFVKGLINLRGQIATAVGLKELLNIESNVNCASAVVCRLEGNLVSLQVDSIGEVIEVENAQFESVPDTIQNSVKNFLRGIYKIEGSLLSVLDIQKIAKEFSRTVEQSE